MCGDIFHEDKAYKKGNRFLRAKIDIDELRCVPVEVEVPAECLNRSVWQLTEFCTLTGR